MSRGALALLDECRGHVVRGIRRVHFLYQDELDESVGPIEIVLDDGRVLLCDVGPDGQALSIQATPWVDPFSPPLSDENTEFVERHGKWTAVDVHDRAPYAELVGEPVRDVTPIVSEGVVEGFDMLVGGHRLHVHAEGDELDVAVSPAGDETA